MPSIFALTFSTNKRRVYEDFHGEVREANSSEEKSGSECCFAPFDNGTPPRAICRQLVQEANPQP